MASVAMGAFATNNFSTTGTSISAADFVTAMRTYWAKLREKGVKKILQLGVQTRGTSTDAWVTEANQTIAAGWLAGGNVEQYYGMLPAEIAAGRVDGFLNYQSWRGTDPNKWKIDPVEGKGTSDSTHPLGWVHRDEAVEIRAKLTSMGMKA